MLTVCITAELDASEQVWRKKRLPHLCRRIEQKSVQSSRVKDNKGREKTNIIE